jgi:hypothetical protein
VAGFKQVSACVVFVDESDIICSMERVHGSCDSSISGLYGIATTTENKY